MKDMVVGVLAIIMLAVIVLMVVYVGSTIAHLLYLTAREGWQAVG